MKYYGCFNTTISSETVSLESAYFVLARLLLLRQLLDQHVQALQVIFNLFFCLFLSLIF